MGDNCSISLYVANTCRCLYAYIVESFWKLRKSENSFIKSSVVEFLNCKEDTDVVGNHRLIDNKTNNNFHRQ